MSIPKLSAYLTIHNYVPFTLSPGPNSIPQGTALWTNASIPRDGVFTSGWGAITTTNGINGVATWRVFHSNNTTTTITIRAHVHENAPHFVSASSDQPTIVAVSVGDYQPEVFPLKADIVIRPYVSAPPPSSAELLEDEPAGNESTQ